MTVKDAVEKYKLDKRKNWFSFCGNLVTNNNVTIQCCGCKCDCSSEYECGHGNGGCIECGYTGKIKINFPAPALDIFGNVIQVTEKDFIYYKKLKHRNK